MKKKMVFFSKSSGPNIRKRRKPQLGPKYEILYGEEILVSIDKKFEMSEDVNLMGGVH